ncbi:MAG: glycerol-3-phosphate dehydrogenase subunit GlpB [Deltaproteobacteria bacterium]|nr:glycerol-3-phosphate dehydrogenase subunit GlpB [Deltaproteobacteria bacterium]
MNLDPMECDLAVIGCGIAGMAATMFAVNRGLSTCQVGSPREIGFASGLLDLLGIHPISEAKPWHDPWAGLDALVRDVPQHPYAKLNKSDIRAAFDELLEFLKSAGLPYSRHPEYNSSIITHIGTMKTTYGVPETMWKGVEAFEQKKPCLIVDFTSLKGFNAGLIVNRLKPSWPGLCAARIDFPVNRLMAEVLPEHMANTLATPNNREQLAQLIRPHVNDVEFVGIPAVLGLYRPTDIASDISQRVGVPVFEISTMPPAITGLRLKEAFERGMGEKRAHYFPRNHVTGVKHEKTGRFKVSIGPDNVSQTVLSKGVVLATGRFIGGGLHGDRTNIRETLFDLPVYQPETRTKWHRVDFLDRRGHLINQAGLETDDHFRPLASNGRPAFETLFAAGSILAHQDWKRMKCGAGLAVATAFGAVRAFVDHFRSKNYVSK